MNYIITGKNFTSPLIEKAKNSENINVYTEEELKNSDIKFDINDKIYAPDETSVPIFLKRTPEEKRKSLETIKNKLKCRELLRTIYPDFFFRSVGLNELASIELPENKKIIIKPQKGFFGVGVKEINSESNLAEIAEELKAEMTKNIEYFSEEMFTMEEFIIEEFIEGEEYAFDIFYDKNGEPVLTNFMHHPPAKESAYFHLLYYSNKIIYDLFAEEVLDIFRKFNKTLNLKNVPVHAEFKAEEGGQLLPIEFNIPRFGGFGLADLPFYGFGLDPFQQFFLGEKIDWPSLFEGKEDKTFGWVLCYNGTEADVKTQKPNYEKLSKSLGNILHLIKMDYTKNPVFALAYVELTSRKQIENLLNMDFNIFFE